MRATGFNFISQKHSLQKLLSAFVFLILLTCISQVRAQENVKIDSSQVLDILQFADVPPEFPGGMEAMNMFIYANLKQPGNLAAEGLVIARIINNETGLVTEPEIVRGLTPEADAETLRIISLLPRWKPGMHNGKIVNVRYNLPVRFKIPCNESKGKSKLKRK